MTIAQWDLFFYLTLTHPHSPSPARLGLRIGEVYAIAHRPIRRVPPRFVVDQALNLVQQKWRSKAMTSRICRGSGMGESKRTRASGVRVAASVSRPLCSASSSKNTESRAIMQYLASKKPESGLLPKDEQARADVTRWQFWDSSHFSPQLGTLTFEKMIKGMIGHGRARPGQDPGRPHGVSALIDPRL